MSQRVCYRFNQPRGCPRGSACPFEHVPGPSRPLGGGGGPPGDGAAKPKPKAKPADPMKRFRRAAGDNKQLGKMRRLADQAAAARKDPRGFFAAKWAAASTRERATLFTRARKYLPAETVEAWLARPGGAGAGDAGGPRGPLAIKRSSAAAAPTPFAAQPPGTVQPSQPLQLAADSSCGGGEAATAVPPGRVVSLFCAGVPVGRVRALPPG